MFDKESIEEKMHDIKVYENVCHTLTRQTKHKVLLSGYFDNSNGIFCEDFIIGHNNNIPWYDKNSPDVQLFKQQSMSGNAIVVMGNNTFLSMKRKPLSDRINLVLTNNKDLTPFPFEELNVHKLQKSKAYYISGWQLQGIKIPMHFIGGPQLIDSLVTDWYLNEHNTHFYLTVYNKPSSLTSTNCQRLTCLTSEHKIDTIFSSSYEHPLLGRLEFNFNLYKL